MKLIQTFFKEKELDRRNEYYFCIQKNIEKSFVDEIHFLIDEEDALNEALNEDIFKHPKVFIKKIDKRLEYGFALEYARNNFSPDDVVAILNLDIFFEDSDAWKNIKSEFFINDNAPRAMALCRKEYFGENVPTQTFGDCYEKGHFADSWIFQTKYLDNFLQKEDLNFCVGLAPCCDGLMFGLMRKHFIVFNWAEKYVTLHFDICRKSQNRNPVYTDKTDWRAHMRQEEAIGAGVPPGQKWEQIFEISKRN